MPRALHSFAQLRQKSPKAGNCSRCPYAIDVVANNYNTASPRAVEAAISERREAIAALGQVLKQEPRAGFR